MTTFSAELMRKVASSLPEWHEDNYDVSRFGALKRSPRRVVTDLICSKGGLLNGRRLQRRMENMGPYLDGLERTWSLLGNEQSKTLLVDLMAYRLLGFRHVKLPTNTPSYWAKLRELEARAEGITDQIDTGFMHFRLARMKLDEFGLRMQAYCRPPAIMAQLVLKQYSYESGEDTIRVEEGDVVMDCGGCWGETALYFAEYAGPAGRVISFEFVPSNLEIFEKNLELNPELKERITIQRNPLWSSSEGELFYENRGPSSRVEPKKFEGATGSVGLKTIDEVFEEQSLPKISFIKMDIEGAELEALRGGERSIRKFKPKLAIALYHSLDDFCRIPDYLASLDLGYRFYLKHATIQAEESVLFAIAD